MVWKVFGLAPMFTERANRGEVQIIEETETSLVLGLRARVSGVGFFTVVGVAGY